MNTANKGTENTDSETGSLLLLFNYHEHQIHCYRLLGEDHEDFHEQALIVTHFPNPYASRSSETSRETRVVRVPRVFDGEGAWVPQFSTVLPGYEEAAITDEDCPHDFVARGEHMGQLFGSSSVSPLSRYFTAAEFRDLTENVNRFLRNAYAAWTFWNVIEFLLNLISFWMLSELRDSTSRKQLASLEEYINETNTTLKNRGVHVVSLKRSAYLSLDFQIDAPSYEQNIVQQTGDIRLVHKEAMRHAQGPRAL